MSGFNWIKTAVFPEGAILEWIPFAVNLVIIIFLIAAVWWTSGTASNVCAGFALTLFMGKITYDMVALSASKMESNLLPGDASKLLNIAKKFI